jgi:histone deacetylase complex regulatory component SIN3
VKSQEERFQKIIASLFMLKLYFVFYTTAVHMRCIKDLYRYRENEITIALRHDPEKAVSQIIAKLKQKIAEWRVAKEKIWNKIWNVSYRRNYIHALDHRRFYWRTQEKKQIHPKGIYSLCHFKNCKAVLSFIMQTEFSR